MYALGSLLVNVFVAREDLTYAAGMVEIFTGLGAYFHISEALMGRFVGIILFICHFRQHDDVDRRTGKNSLL